MSYTATVSYLRNIRPHPDPDVNRIELATCQGNQIIIKKGTRDDVLGIYFPPGGVIDNKFLSFNNLYRDPKLNRDSNKNGFFEINGRIRSQKFKGEISNGMWVPVDHLLPFFATEEEIESIESQKDINKLSDKYDLNIIFNDGDSFDSVNGISLCKKWIIKENNENLKYKKNKPQLECPTFYKHQETDHFYKNIKSIRNYDGFIWITEKLHGTSGRTGLLNVKEKKKVQLSFWERLLTGFKKSYKTIEEYNWKMVSGSKNVFLGDLKQNQSDGWHDESIRIEAADVFRDLLHKGETVYYEIVGFESHNKPIMPPGDIKHLGKDTQWKPNFNNSSENKIYWKYGCGGVHKKLDVYIYRITMTNEDGVYIDLSPQGIIDRCNEIGVKHVPFLEKIRSYDIMKYYNKKSKDDRDLNDFFFTEIYNRYLRNEKSSYLDQSHPMEGIILRLDKPYWESYKLKSNTFRLLESNLNVPDPEDNS